MHKMRQVCSVAAYNFRSWKRNPRIVITFGLAFVLCFLLSDKVVQFAIEQGTTTQIVEPFIWTFGDANSILLVSLLLLLLFADMPFLTSGTPFYLGRINRRIWLAGQALYVIVSTFILITFTLISTSIICMSNSFVGNMWSETAAILGYSDAYSAIAIPAFVKTLEMSFPYQSMLTIFGLMLAYALLMAFIMLYFNLKKGQTGGIIAFFIFSLFGFLLNPQLFKQILGLTDETMYIANVIVGWLSPLNQATYHLHNFGYDLLPRMWMTFAIFGFFIIILFILSIKQIKKYNFDFKGTEQTGL